MKLCLTRLIVLKLHADSLGADLCIYVGCSLAIGNLAMNKENGWKKDKFGSKRRIQECRQTLPLKYWFYSRLIKLQLR